MATRKPRRFNKGDLVEAEDKESGLKASKGEKVGFFDRLRMGNIDDPSSEAYKRFGAGRGKMERTPVEDAVAVPVSRAKAPEMDELEEADKRYRESPIEVPPGPRATSSGSTGVSGGRKTSSESKASPKMQEKTYTRSAGATAKEREEYQPSISGGIYSNEGRGRGMTKEQQYARAEAEAQSPEGKAKRRQQEESQALERVTPETALLPGGGLKALHGFARKLAAPKMATYTQPALSAPTSRLAYDKAGAVGRAREARAAARQEEMLAENAARYGLDPKAPGYEAAADAIRKGLGGKDFSFKRGGAVKKPAKLMKPVKKMASGGSVSGASKRADGIALRGKTRGKIY